MRWIGLPKSWGVAARGNAIMIKKLVAMETGHHVDLAVHRLVSIASDWVPLMFGRLHLTSAGGWADAAIGHRFRRLDRCGDSVGVTLSELNVAADSISHHWSWWAWCSLSKKTRVSVAWTSWRVAYSSVAIDSVFGRTMVHNVVVEDLSNAAFRCVWHPVFAMTDFVKLDVLELSVGCHFTFLFQ